MDVTSDWFWEGNVVAALAKHLEAEGWSVDCIADTASKAQGVDLQARRGGVTLLVEAKGYPSTVYRDPARANEHKPTNPTNQAQQWFSHALLKATRLQNKHRQATVALCFPDFPRYRALFNETVLGLTKLAVPVFFVAGDGLVCCENDSGSGCSRSIVEFEHAAEPESQIR